MEVRQPTRLIDDPQEAGLLLATGLLVAFPTETVYGLGGAIDQKATIERIFEAKGRPADNPLIVHLAQRSVLESVVAEIPPLAEELMEAFWPGPLTLVFKKQPWVSELVTAGLDSVAVRSPSSEIAREILLSCRKPIAAPSANRSGRPSATTWEAVAEDLWGHIDAVFRGPPCSVGIESTVVDCTGVQPELLRAGGVTIEQLLAVRPDTVLLQRDAAAANSPGLRHPHYQPKAQVVLKNEPESLVPDPSLALLSYTPHSAGDEFGLYLCCSSLESYAAELYEFFRQADRCGISQIYCEIVPEKGVGRAIMDRLRRAAAYRDDARK